MKREPRAVLSGAFCHHSALEQRADTGVRGAPFAGPLKPQHYGPAGAGARGRPAHCTGNMTGKQVVNRSLSTHITPKSKTTVIGSLKVPVRHIGLHLRHKFRVVDRARAAKVDMSRIAGRTRTYATRQRHGNRGEIEFELMQAHPSSSMLAKTASTTWRGIPPRPGAPRPSTCKPRCSNARQNSSISTFPLASLSNFTNAALRIRSSERLCVDRAKRASRTCWPSFSTLSARAFPFSFWESGFCGRRNPTGSGTPGPGCFGGSKSRLLGASASHCSALNIFIRKSSGRTKPYTDAVSMCAALSEPLDFLVDFCV